MDPVNAWSQGSLQPVGVSSPLTTNVYPFDEKSCYQDSRLSTRPVLNAHRMAISATTDSPVKHTRYTSFDLKIRELNQLKLQAQAHMRRLNVLKVHYVDWFERCHKRFVDSLNLFQCITPQCVYLSAATIGNFRKDYETAKKLSEKGFSLERCVTLMGEYLGFWDQLLELHKQGQFVHKKISDYCDGVTEMGQPQLNEIIGHLQVQLNKELSENFCFVNVRETSSDLFTYKVGHHDQRLQRLLAFIPHLLQTSTHICYLCSKMCLEKE